MYKKKCNSNYTYYLLIDLSFSPYAFAAKDAEPDFNTLSKETGFTVKKLKKEWKLFLDIKDYMKLDDESGQIIFDDKAALKAGLTQEIVDKVQADLKKINQSEILENCGGINGSAEYSWGWRVWLDSCETNGIIGLLTAGAGVATIAAAIAAVVSIPAAVAFGIAAGLLAIGAGVLTYYNRTGCGVIMDYYYTDVIIIQSQKC
ncbi:MAG: hypothetical protein K6U04_13830 [Armatimonadetes bacterium]|nr:hypothetical protein [Armatimonadota bacterium]